MTLIELRPWFYFAMLANSRKGSNNADTTDENLNHPGQSNESLLHSEVVENF
jgi:hypothetical protein